MEVRNCRRCGAIFNYLVGQMICPNCKEEEEKKFQAARKYVSDNKKVTIQELADEVEVEPQIIRKWIRDDRLQFSDDSAIGLECERCGAMIRSGRFCEECKTNMTSELNSAYGTGPTIVKREDNTRKQAARMRFLEK